MQSNMAHQLMIVLRPVKYPFTVIYSFMAPMLMNLIAGVVGLPCAMHQWKFVPGKVGTLREFSLVVTILRGTGEIPENPLVIS